MPNDIVRHGYVPLLGHDTAGGGDRDVRLHRKGKTVTLLPDGAVLLHPSGTQGDSVVPATSLAGDDRAGFDALFPPDAPNQRNVVRRLYEMGLGSR